MSSIGGTIRSFFAGLTDLALPDTCTGCDRKPAGEYRLCDQCAIDLLELASKRYCPRCGASAGNFTKLSLTDGCFDCPSPLPAFSRVYRIGPYSGPVRNIIRTLKYHTHSNSAEYLINLAAQTISLDPNAPQFDAIFPIPMFWTRRILRGIDHTTALAHSLGKALDIPVYNNLIRTRNTPPQVNLSRSQRLENVRNAFSLKRPAKFTGKNIIIVDDVTTTGATASEAARTLLNAGCSSVTLVVIAKAEKQSAYSHSSTSAE